MLIIASLIIGAAIVIATGHDDYASGFAAAGVVLWLIGIFDK
jgi:hypothetical protein